MATEVPPALSKKGVIKAFNDRVIFATAYNWTKDQVVGFFREASQDNNPYAVPPANLPVLQNIWGYIQQLSHPDGEYFNDPEPKQFTYRKSNPSWSKEKEENIPKCLLLKFPGVQGQKYFGIYDLLATFVSLMGPAPAAATADNFYIPLTLVFGSWCQHVNKEYKAPNDINIPHPPFMLQCTWKVYKLTGSSRAPDFFLGCSMGGVALCVDLGKGKMDPWRREVQHGRFDLIDDAQFRAEGFNFETKAKAPSAGENVKQLFGNCAETYPFMTLMRGQKKETETCHGFAIRRTDVQGSKFHVKKIAPPCANCEFLIDFFNGNPDNFSPSRYQPVNA